jgi:hypothetical protein
MMHRHPDLDDYMRTLGHDVTPLPDDPAYTEDYPVDWPDAPMPIDDALAAMTPGDRIVVRLAAAFLFFTACAVFAIATTAWRHQ